MYGTMNGGTMWGIESSWLVICIILPLGVAAFFAYRFFSRRWWREYHLLFGDL